MIFQIFIRVNPCSSVSDYLRPLFTEQAPRAASRRYLMKMWQVASGKWQVAPTYNVRLPN